MSDDFLADWKNAVLNGVEIKPREAVEFWKEVPLLKGGFYGLATSASDIKSFITKNLSNRGDIAYISLDPDDAFSKGFSGIYVSSIDVAKEVILKSSHIYSLFVIGPARLVRDAKNLRGFQVLQEFYRENSNTSPSIILHALEDGSSGLIDSTYLHLTSMTEKTLR